jgi:hypothetical protein
MADFQVLPFDFSSTTVTFVALSQAAKQRFGGAVSVEIRKSYAQDYLDRLESEGFFVEAV